MKIKVSEATPLQLDWLVAKAEGLVDDPHSGFNVQVPTRLKLPPICRYYGNAEVGYETYRPTKDWEQGGPIAGKLDGWRRLADGSFMAYKAHIPLAYQGWGPTPLIAAMRCYVISEMGDEVEVPDELSS